MPDFIFDKALRPTVTRDEKGLRVSAVVGRVGVQSYLNTDGSVRRELRHPDHLFAAKSLASLELLPVTNGHPNISDMPLTTKNMQYFQVGKTGDTVVVDQARGEIVQRLAIDKAEALEAIEQGRREVSPGYERDLLMTPGVWEGQAYDAIQVNIRYDHIAIVDQARAGHEARLLLDGTIQASNPKGSEMSVEVTKATLEIKGVRYEVDAGLASAAKSVLDEAQAKVDEAVAKAAQFEAERDAAQEALKSAESKAVDGALTSQIEAGVRARLALIVEAKEVMGSDFACDGLSDAEVRCAVVKQVFPALEDKYRDGNETYKVGLYDSARAQVQKDQSKAHLDVKKALDSAPVKEAAVDYRQAAIDRQNQMARTPIRELLGAK